MVAIAGTVFIKDGRQQTNAKGQAIHNQDTQDKTKKKNPNK